MLDDGRRERNGEGLRRNNNMRPKDKRCATSLPPRTSFVPSRERFAEGLKEYAYAVQGKRRVIKMVIWFVEDFRKQKGCNLPFATS